MPRSRKWASVVAYLAAAARSFSTPAGPRQLSWVEVKRDACRVGHTYGHWWIELDGKESYGWWPRDAPSACSAS